MHNNTETELPEIQRLLQSLGELEAELNDHYRDIGKCLLELAEKEDKQINSLVDRIIETRKQIVALQRQVRCPGCLSYNPPDSCYCSHCGTKLSLRGEIS